MDSYYKQILTSIPDSIDFGFIPVGEESFMELNDIKVIFRELFGMCPTLKIHLMAHELETAVENLVQRFC